MDKNYELFVEQLKNGINTIIGIPMEHMKFRKEGERYAEAGDRLLVDVVEHKDAWESCGLYTEELFEAYQKGQPFEDILEEIADDIRKLMKSGLYDKTKNLRIYEIAKKRIFVRLLNRDKYAIDLQDAIYKIVGDIALVVYAQVSIEENCVTSTKIREAMLNYWKKDNPEINEDSIFKEALENTYRMNPPRIYKWEHMIFNPGYTGESFMEACDNRLVSKEAMGNCLSTALKTNGAVSVFLPGVADRLAELLNADFYMVFTSVHEVMIHNAEKIEPENLVVVLKDVLDNETPKTDYLTSKIYKYDRETHEFTCVLE